MSEPNVPEQLSDHPEFVSVSVSEPLRQGDIFEWREQNGDPWQLFGVIITADCDLHLQKHRGILSYVPILLLGDFLAHHWFPDQLERRLRAPLESAASQMRQVLPAGAAITDAPDYNLKDWLLRDGVDGVLRELGPLPSERLGKLQESLEVCARLLRAMTIRDLRPALEELVELTVLTTDLERTAATTNIWSQLQTFVQRLPGDSFFLSAISQHNSGGFVAYLRRVQEIQATQFAASTLEFERAAVVRISRLKATYKYRLTQQLAGVFADIGLPDEYTNACRTAINELRQQHRPITARE